MTTCYAPYLWALAYTLVDHITPEDHIWIGPVLPWSGNEYDITNKMPILRQILIYVVHCIHCGARFFANLWGS